MLTLATLALACSPHVLTVTSGGGAGTYPTIQFAISEAVDGDTILIDLPSKSSARMAGFVIYDKALVIQGITPGPDGSAPEIGVPIGPMRIIGLSEGKSVTLRGLEAKAGILNGFGLVPALGVEDSAGTVRLERCEMSAPTHYDGSPAVELNFALDVTMVDSFVGGSKVAGTRLRRSRLSAIDTILTAGRPELTEDPGSGYALGEDGPPSLVLESRSFAWLGDCEVEGGAGGGAFCQYLGAGCNTTGGDGGPGVLTEPGSLCVEVGSTILGGAPGFPDSQNGTHTWGQTGPETVGTVTRVPGAQRRLTVPEVIQRGDQIHARFDGVPGEEVWLLGGRAGGHRYLGWQWGVLQVNGPYDLAPTLLGVVPESGSLRTDFSLPDLGADLARTISLQAFFRSAPNRYRLSEVQDVTVVTPEAPDFERQTILHVNGSAPPGGDGRSWSTAYQSLSLAVLDPASTQEDTRFPPEIWMAQGTYISAAPLTIERNLAVYGGFQGNENSRDQRDPRQFPTWLDGDVDQNDSVGIFSDNASGLLRFIGHPYAASSAHLDGLSFRGSQGASAIYCQRARVSMEACRWESNHAGSNGLSGAISTRLTDTSGYSAFAHQAGYRGFLPGLLIKRCEFYDNSGFHAGAVWVRPAAPGSQPYIRFHCTDSVFSGNHASGVDDSGASNGGSITINSSGNPDPFEAVLVGNTFFENERPAAAAQTLHVGGVRVQPEHRIEFVNNICWSSLGGTNNTFVTMMGDAEDSVHHNCMHTLPGSLGTEPSNFIALPRFRDTRGPDGMAGTGDEDLRPLPTSPCVDSGDQGSLSPLSPLDILGRPRVVDQATAAGTSVDLGAFEVQ